MNGVAKYCQRRWLWSGGMLPSSPLNWAWQALNMDRERGLEREEKERVCLGWINTMQPDFLNPCTRQGHSLPFSVSLLAALSLTHTHTGMYTYTQSPVINYLAWLACRLTANANEMYFCKLIYDVITEAQCLHDHMLHSPWHTYKRFCFNNTLARKKKKRANEWTRVGSDEYGTEGEREWGRRTRIEWRVLGGVRK